MAIKEHYFSSIESASHTLANDLASCLRKAISSRGHASLAVSGGRTPKHVFDQLCRLDLDWHRVIITLTDERWVNNDHTDSNEKLVYSYLLKDSAASATFIPLFGGEDSPVAGQSACESRLKSVNLPFDAVYLGIGSDGHFASLFPGDDAVEARDSLCVPVPETESRLPRMTLSAPVILNTKKIFILFSGHKKFLIYSEAKKSGSYNDIPLRLVLLQEQIPVSVLILP